MKMSDNNKEPLFFSAEESPIPLPPVEKSWSLMRKRLDITAPILGGWGRSIGWIIFAGIIMVVSVTVWLTMRTNPSGKTSMGGRATKAAVSSQTMEAPADSPTMNAAAGSGAMKAASGSGPDSSRSATVFAKDRLPGQGGGMTAVPEHPAGSARVRPAGTPSLSSSPVSQANPASVPPISQDSYERSLTARGHHAASDNAARGRYTADNNTTRGRHTAGEIGSSGHHETGNDAAPGRYAVTSAHRSTGVDRLTIAQVSDQGAQETSTAGILDKNAVGLPFAYYPFLTMKDTAFFNHHPFSALTTGGPAGYGASKRKSASSGSGGLHVAAGLSISQRFPIGAQQSYPYNINAKKNWLSDYIPAPYFQFYFRNNVYLQIALQFNSPQYTSPSSASNTSTTYNTNSVAVGTSDTLTTTVALKKLYYTDVPLTLYYSPFRHLFIGTGLQYSHYRGGVALQSTKGSRTDSAGYAIVDINTSQVITLKDTAAKKIDIRETDWRALFDINYNWKRFTLGARFQSPLTNYLLTKPSGSQGTDRNSSFGVYLQYNVWERKPKKADRK